MFTIKSQPTQDTATKARLLHANQHYLTTHKDRRTTPKAFMVERNEHSGSAVDLHHHQVHLVKSLPPALARSVPASEPVAPGRKWHHKRKVFTWVTRQNVVSDSLSCVAASTYSVPGVRAKRYANSCIWWEQHSQNKKIDISKVITGLVQDHDL
jgi:hypothetical protein